MSQTTRVAFVGAGSHATHALYPHLHKLPNLDLVAVCDLDREKAERNARWFGARNVYTDVTMMLSGEHLDGVYICGLPQMMCEVGEQVLMARLPIFVEKPSGIDVPKARKLAQAAEDNGVWGMVAFMKRFAPAYVEARRIIESASFGGLQMLEVRFAQGPYPQWAGIDDTMLAMLTGQLCHIFDLIRFIGGDVESVQVSQRYLSPERLGLLVSVEFASGAIGVMNLNTLEGSEENPWIDIVEHLRCTGIGQAVTVDQMLYFDHHKPGEKAAGEQTEPFPHRLDSARATWLAVAQQDLCGYAGEVADFAKCLREGHPPNQGADLWDGMHSLELTEAVYASATNEGKRVSVPVR